MKTNLFCRAFIITACICLFNALEKAQSQDLEIFGLSSTGGKYKGGAIFKNDEKGNFIIVKDIDKINAANPTGAMCKAFNGKLYGAASTNRIFEFDPITGSYTEKHKFEQYTMFHGNLIQATNGKLYGMAFPNFGSSGCLFELDPLTGSYSSKHEIAYGYGMESVGSLVQSSNGLIYGITSCGGSFGYGAIFEWNPETNIYTEKISFIDTINGSEALGALTEAENGKFYGITSKGGANDMGILFIWDPSSNSFCKLLDFDGVSTGSEPVGSLAMADNGRYYGLARSGGVYNLGVLFEWDPVNQLFTKKYDFGNSICCPTGSMFKMPDGNLTAITGGGVIYEWDPVTEVLQVNHRKTDNEQGKVFCGTLIQADNGKLYGLAEEGGVHNLYDSYGVLFEWDPLDSLYKAKVLFNGATEGMNPVNMVETSNNMFVGAFRLCETNDYGALFEFNPVTCQYTKKFDFEKKHGMFPGPLVKAKDGMLYGYTWSTYEIDDSYRFFRWNPFTDSCTILFNSMEEDNGKKSYYSSEALIPGMDSSLLYGVQTHNIMENCPLFELNLNSLTYTEKLRIDGRNARLLFRGQNGKVYGTASKLNDDYLFEWDPVLNAITQKTDSAFFRFESLVQATDGKLYGAGILTGGTYFYEWDATTNHIITKLNLSDLVKVGNNSITNLTAGQDGNLYGTIYDYDKLDYYVFQWDPLKNDFRKLYDIPSEDSAAISQLIIRIKPSSQPVDLTQGLIAYYPFNGNANDESGNGHDGIVNGATLTSDRFENANSSYYFNTNNATIQLPNSMLNDLPNATISLWVYWKGERPSIIMAKQHDWVDSYYVFGIGMYNIGGGVDNGETGRIYFRVKNNSSTLISNSRLESNKWNHLVISIDQDLKLYINGILDSEISGSDFVLPDDPNATSTTLGLWLQDVRYSGVMNGNLDDIRFYNRALNFEEIQSLFTEENISHPLPTLTTHNAYSDTPTSATSGGNIISEGNSSVITRGICWSTSPHPDTTENITVDGSGAGSFVSNMTGLVPNTTYYIRAYAINSSGVGYGNEIIYTKIVPEIIYGSISEEGNNIYRTVKIGSQVWMAENMRSPAGADGKEIPLIEDGAIWGSLQTPAYCWYDNDIRTKDTYGALYNRYVIESHFICPSGDGWRIPSEIDWKILEDYMGGADIAGGKMKESGTAHWNSPNIEATDQYGFMALPAGQRSLENGRFTGLGSSTSFWSVTAADPSKSWALYLHHDSTNVSHVPITDKTSGHSVRCLKYFPYSDPHSQVDLEEGLIAYYPFNGNFNDESGNGHHGSTNGGILTTDRFGNANSAYTFTGESNTLSFAGYQIPGSNYTITGWVKITDENADTIFQNTSPAGLKILLRIVNRRYQVEIIIGGNKFALYDEQGIYEIDPQHPRSDFLMLAYQHSNCSFSFRINNSVAAVLFAEGKIVQPVFPITMKNDIVYSLKGIVDDIRIYNRHLGEAEIQALNYEDIYLGQLPKLVTVKLNRITQSSVSVEGLITSSGSSTIKEKGFCWSASPIPDTTDSKIRVGSSVGSLSSNLAGLIPNTTYYIRAYAINNSGIAYGNELIFKTLADSANLMDGLVAYYPFNGNANDESGNDYNGFVEGATLFSDRHGNDKSAYYFNGANSKITIDSFSVPSSITITLWVKSDSANGIRPFISKSRDILISSEGDRYTYRLRINENPIQCPYNHIGNTINPSSSKFDFLVLTYDGDQVNFYINNMLIGTKHARGLIENDYYPLVFGGNGDQFHHYDGFTGVLDDIRIYNRVLSEKELSELFYEGNYPSPFPFLVTSEVRTITQTSAICGGTVNYCGKSPVISKGICWSTSPNPDTTDYRIIDNSAGNNFISHLDNLSPNTTYYIKSYAVNSEGIGYGSERIFNTLPLMKYGSVTDIEGNVYKTIQIGAHKWMAENLKTTKYNDGSPIPIVTDNSDWGSLITGAYCWYKNNENIYKNEYGALYNYFTIIDSRGICPTNWHIPTPDEWSTLPWGENCELNSAHCVLKEAGDAHWKSSPNGTNETGFTALPAGVRMGIDWDGINPSGYFTGLEFLTIFWKSTGDYYFIQSNDDVAFVEWAYNPSHQDGRSIRCVEDNIMTSIETPNLIVFTNTSFDVPILANRLLKREAISYQFELSFDSNKIVYLGNSVDNTILKEGEVQENQLEGRLSFAWAGQSALADSGTLVRLRFKALESGTVTPTISNFLLNTDTIKNIVNGTISISGCYGNVDDNGAIQAYDAALALQYSVGLDPLPDIDPLPWEDWRVASANVDGQDNISAYDASLILQYTVGMIQSFPVEGSLKSTHDLQADVSVNVENGYLVLRSSGNLQGLNMYIEGNPELFGAPQLTYENAIIEANYSSSGISVGLAMANIPPEGEIILKIPLIEITDQALTIELQVNNHEKQMNLDKLTGLSEIHQKPVEIYPNPANTMLYFNNITAEASIRIFDMQGRRVISRTIVNNQLYIGDLSEGLYTIHLTDRNKTIIRKLVRK